MNHVFYKAAEEVDWKARGRAAVDTVLGGLGSLVGGAKDVAGQVRDAVTPEAPKKIPGGWVGMNEELAPANESKFQGLTTYQYGRNPETGEMMQRRLDGAQQMGSTGLGDGDYAATYRAGGGPVTVHDADGSRQMSREDWASEREQGHGPMFNEGEQALAPEGWRMSGKVTRDGSPSRYRFTGPEGESKVWRPGDGAPFAPAKPAGAPTLQGAPRPVSPQKASRIIAQAPQAGQMEILGSREPEPPTPEMLKVARGLYC